jgi:hypothetical protein
MPMNTAVHHATCDTIALVMNPTRAALGSWAYRAVGGTRFEQPFSTGEATLRKEKAGVGVGLHLARQIVVEHGGVLWSDPLPGGGTRVSFCIPVSEGLRFAVPPVDAA